MHMGSASDVFFLYVYFFFIPPYICSLTYAVYTHVYYYYSSMYICMFIHTYLYFQTCVLYVYIIHVHSYTCLHTIEYMSIYTWDVCIVMLRAAYGGQLEVARLLVYHVPVISLLLGPRLT